MSSADFSHLACRGQKLIVGVLPRDGDPVTIVRWQIPQVPGVSRFIINHLLVSHSLPPVGHAPVWVLDVVAVAVVGAVLAGLAGEVHLDHDGDDDDDGEDDDDDGDGDGESTLTGQMSARRVPRTSAVGNPKVIWSLQRLDHVKAN